MFISSLRSKTAPLSKISGRLFAEKIDFTSEYQELRIVFKLFVPKENIFCKSVILHFSYSIGIGIVFETPRKDLPALRWSFLAESKDSNPKTSPL